MRAKKAEELAKAFEHIKAKSAVTHCAPAAHFSISKPSPFHPFTSLN